MEQGNGTDIGKRFPIVLYHLRPRVAQPRTSPAYTTHDPIVLIGFLYWPTSISSRNRITFGTHSGTCV